MSQKLISKMLSGKVVYSDSARQNNNGDKKVSLNKDLGNWPPSVQRPRNKEYAHLNDSIGVEARYEIWG